MANRELGVVHFWVCATELGGCNGRLQPGSSRAVGHPLHVWSHARRGGKGEREREIGSEALAETEKIANAPAGRGVCDFFRFCQSFTSNFPFPFLLSLSPFPPLPFPTFSFPFPSPFDLSFAPKEKDVQESHCTSICPKLHLQGPSVVPDFQCPNNLTLIFELRVTESLYFFENSKKNSSCNCVSAMFKRFMLL